jgi:hypothetical protein
MIPSLVSKRRGGRRRRRRRIWILKRASRFLTRKGVLAVA